MSIAGAPLHDLLACGLFFNDLGFGGLPDSGPLPGHELRVGPYEQTPGGIANASIAATRLGVNVCMVCDAGDDPMTVGAMSLLAEEGIETCYSMIHRGWQTPLTIILNYAGDRAMVTSETAHPGPCALRAPSAPAARVAITHLQPFPMPWLKNAVDAGCKVIGDVGWDESDRWNLRDLPDLPLCHAFKPNAIEAIRYTRTDTPDEALDALGKIVQMPVISMGPHGALALDAGTGERVHIPAIPGPVVDTGGAGDVFSAGLAAGLLTDWPLEQKIRMAILVAALTVSRLGGATTAPTLRELQTWVTHAPPELRRDYGFVLDLSGHWGPGEVSLQPASDEAAAWSI